MEVEDHPYLAKSESVSSVPAFKIYKNGSRVKEIFGKLTVRFKDLIKRRTKFISFCAPKLISS